MENETFLHFESLQPTLLESFFSSLKVSQLNPFFDSTIYQLQRRFINDLKIKNLQQLIIMRYFSVK